MRAIDADEFKEKLKDRADKLYASIAKGATYPSQGLFDGLSYAQCVADGMPTVDAEPVRHGYWIDMGDFESCSVCHKTHLKEFQSYYAKVVWLKTPYCAQCGAKMDGK